MNNRLVFFATVAAHVGATAFAQTREDLKPGEPILPRAPSRAEWTVKSYFAGGSATPGDSAGSDRRKPVESVTVSKDGDTYREVIQRADGRKVEKWIQDGLQVYSLPQSDKIARSVLSARSYSETFSDYRRSDFEELEWIGMDNFTGVTEIGGREVFAFSTDAVTRKLTPRELSSLADPDGTETMEDLERDFRDRSGNESGYTAYLDIATQLPVYFDDGQTKRLYEFAKQPPGQLVAPQRFAAELAEWRSELDRRKPFPRP